MADSWVRAGEIKMGRRTGSPAFILTAFLLVVGIFILASNARDFGAVLLFVPFALGPLLVSLFLALFALRRACQITLIIGSVLYAAWFGYLYIGAFYLHPSPQSGIILLFIGVYSLPGMLPVWGLTLGLMSSAKHPPSKQDGCSNR